jgi:hypothetical protein
MCLTREHIIFPLERLIFPPERTRFTVKAIVFPLKGTRLTAKGIVFLVEGAPFTAKGIVILSEGSGLSTNGVVILLEGVLRRLGIIQFSLNLVFLHFEGGYLVLKSRQIVVAKPKEAAILRSRTC